MSTSLDHKLAPPSPPPCPDNVGDAPERLPLRIAQPGRPPELIVCFDKVKTPGLGALADPSRRAALVHTFFHHELQAAELMCWALLAFPNTPAAFQRGLVRICLDEIRHMKMYAAHLGQLGSHVGAFPVRDWFWSRIPAARSPAEFLAVMGLGFEAGNLDHTRRFAERFRAVGDERGARLQEIVGEEERAHVAFAVHFWSYFAGELTFERWLAALPAPLSPMVMRGDPIDREARLAAGQPAALLDALTQWQPTSRGS